MIDVMRGPAEESRPAPELHPRRLHGLRNLSAATDMRCQTVRPVVPMSAREVRGDLQRTELEGTALLCLCEGRVAAPRLAV